MLPAFLWIGMMDFIKTRRRWNYLRCVASRWRSLQLQCGRTGGWSRTRLPGTISRAAREALPEDPAEFHPSDGRACTAASPRAELRLPEAAVRDAMPQAPSLA